MKPHIVKMHKKICEVINIKDEQVSETLTKIKNDIETDFPILKIWEEETKFEHFDMKKITSKGIVFTYSDDSNILWGSVTLDSAWKKEVKAKGLKLNHSNHSFNKFVIGTIDQTTPFQDLKEILNHTLCDIHEQLQAYKLDHPRIEQGIRLLDKIPSGISKIDSLTKGGFSKGQISMISGTCGSGKSSLAFRTIISTMKKNKNVVFLDFDDRMAQLSKMILDETASKSLSKKMDRLICISEPDASLGLKYLLEIPESYRIDLLVIDGPIRTNQQDNIHHQNGIAPNAIFTRRFLQHIRNFVNEKSCAAIITAQTRMDRPEIKQTIENAIPSVSAAMSDAIYNIKRTSKVVKFSVLKSRDNIRTDEECEL